MPEQGMSLIEVIYVSDSLGGYTQYQAAQPEQYQVRERQGGEYILSNPEHGG